MRMLLQNNATKHGTRAGGGACSLGAVDKRAYLQGSMLRQTKTRNTNKHFLHSGVDGPLL